LPQGLGDPLGQDGVARPDDGQRRRLPHEQFPDLVAGAAQAPGVVPIEPDEPAGQRRPEAEGRLALLDQLGQALADAVADALTELLPEHPLRVEDRDGRGVRPQVRADPTDAEAVVEREDVGHQADDREPPRPEE